MFVNSGSTLTWIKRAYISTTVTASLEDEPIVGSTMAEKFTSNASIQLHGIAIPEFPPSKSLVTLKMRVIETDSCYDVIVGRNVCTLYDIVIDFEQQVMLSSSTMVPMRRKVPLSVVNKFSITQIREHENKNIIITSTYEHEELNDDFAISL